MLLPALLLPPAAAQAPTRAVVISITDGDTLTLSTGELVRLRGVNAPGLRPSEEYSIEAREVTRALVLNQEVTLDYGAAERDEEGRLLASVATADGTDLGSHLVVQGLAHLFVVPPDDLDITLLQGTQRTARASNRGIWGTERYQGALHITSLHANAEGNDNENVNGEHLRVCNVSGAPVVLDGYTLRNLAGRSWPLPAVEVPVGHTVLIRSGVGSDQLDPSVGLEVYLGSDRPIWNNTRDRAVLYDRAGRVIDAVEHE